MIGSVGGGRQNSDGFADGGALTITIEKVCTAESWTYLFNGWFAGSVGTRAANGVSKGRSLWHTTLLARSSVLCLPSD
jgi:hypothetical protein